MRDERLSTAVGRVESKRQRESKKEGKARQARPPYLSQPAFSISREGLAWK
jgi:hypothetical protein